MLHAVVLLAYLTRCFAQLPVSLVGPAHHHDAVLACRVSKGHGVPKSSCLGNAVRMQRLICGHAQSLLFTPR